MSQPPNPNYLDLLEQNGMPVSEAAITADFKKSVQESGFITNSSHMSPFWRLVSSIVVTPTRWLQQTLADVVLKNLFLATATSKFLDLHAWGVGLTRKEATKAQGVVTFYKQNDADAITIKSGTRVQTERINGKVFSLIVSEDTEIKAGVSSARVPAQAEEAGTGHNLAPGYYRILPESIAGISLACTEEEWLTNPGADTESDDDLRARSRTKFSSVGSHHIDAVYRSAIAQVAGLSVDRIFFEHDAPRGAGTANAYLLLDTGVLSQPFIDAVNTFIMDMGHHGHGDDLRCFALPETKHALSVQVFVSPFANMSESQKSELAAAVAQFIRCAFRENDQYSVTKTAPHSRFSVSLLGEELHQRFPQIVSLKFSLDDIISELNIPRLSELTVEICDA